MQAVIFDLDGTLGDTLPLCVAAFREAVEPLVGRELSDEAVIATFGPSEEGTIRLLVPDRYNEGVSAYLASYERLHAGWPEPFDGVRELLGALETRGVFVGMVTGKGPHSTEITLGAYGIRSRFVAIKTGSPTGPVKRERIEELMREHALDPALTVYVGDSPSDVMASHACGIRCAAVAWASTADRAALAAQHPEWLLGSVAELRALLLGD